MLQGESLTQCSTKTINYIVKWNAGERNWYKAVSRPRKSTTNFMTYGLQTKIRNQDFLSHMKRQSYALRCDFVTRAPVFRVLCLGSLERVTLCELRTATRTKRHWLPSGMLMHFICLSDGNRIPIPPAVTTAQS
jgi:hypothetical protein